MRIAFKATEAGFEDDGYTQICGISGHDSAALEHYLNFQQLNESVAAEQPDEDDGIHLEFDEQSNGDYNCICSCRLNRSYLVVELSKQLGRLEDVEGFDVNLSIDDNSFADLATGLRRIFRKEANRLQIT